MVPPELLRPCRKVFSKEEAKVLPPHRPEGDCHIDLIHPDTYPFKKRSLYQLTPDEEKAQEEWIDEHVAKGYIRPSKAKICASPFFIAKKDNEENAPRMFLDMMEKSAQQHPVQQRLVVGHDHGVGDVGLAADIEQFDINCFHVLQRREHLFLQGGVASRSATRASGRSVTPKPRCTCSTRTWRRSVASSAGACWRSWPATRF